MYLGYKFLSYLTLIGLIKKTIVIITYTMQYKNRGENSPLFYFLKIFTHTKIIFVKEKISVDMLAISCILLLRVAI